MKIWKNCDSWLKGRNRLKYLLFILYTNGRAFVQVCTVKCFADEEPSEVEDSQRKTQHVVVVELNDHNI